MDSAGDVTLKSFEPFDGKGSLENGILILSEHRAFAHEEAAYDTQYDHEAPDAAPGMRLVDMLGEFGISPGGSILEIGCGTGFLTVGLAQSDFFGHIVVTDGSLDFVKIAKAKLERAKLANGVEFALLQADDIYDIGQNQFNVIAMRSVLHHVNDFQSFVDLLLEKLGPGGVLACFEPRAESFMWMGTVMAMFADAASAHGITLTQEDRGHIQLFIDTMAFYLRRDMDKSAGEDKHAFWMEELLQASTRNGAQTAFYSESVSSDPVDLLLEYLKYCMSFPEDLLKKVALGLDPLRATMGAFMAGHPSPDLAGWFLFRRIPDGH